MLLQTTKDYGLLLPDRDCFAALTMKGKMQQYAAKDYGTVTGSAECGERFKIEKGVREAMTRRGTFETLWIYR